MSGKKVEVQVKITCNGKTYERTYQLYAVRDEELKEKLKKVLNERMDPIKKLGCKRVRISIRVKHSDAAEEKKEAKKFAAILNKVFAELGYNDSNVTWDGDTVTVEGQLEGVDLEHHHHHH
uniref:Top7 Fold Protein Top7m13 n=1 Tax=synthetic construct TaxID=32630 RepID=UPI0003C63F44|nr:Chain A, Top7 Fold Protein Top7m13 [synthetic construct]2MBM_A Chain A, Top7 Fold Protein Top7m13 [synthetic construct]